VWNKPLTEVHDELMTLSKNVKKNESSQEIILAFLKSFWYIEIGFGATAITAFIAKPEYIIAPISAIISLAIIRQIAQSKLDKFDDKITELKEKRDTIASHMRERESRARGRFLQYKSAYLPTAPSGPRPMRFEGGKYPVESLINPLEKLGKEVVEDMRYIGPDIVDSMKAIHSLQVEYETTLDLFKESAGRSIKRIEEKSEWQYSTIGILEAEKIRGLYRFLIGQVRDHADYGRYALEFTPGEAETIDFLLSQDERNPFLALRGQSDLMELAMKLEEIRTAFHEKYIWLEYEIVRRFGEIREWPPL